MIRNEVLTVDVGGSFIYPQSVNLTAGVGKGYNTCTITGTNLVGSVNDSVTVNVNGDVYTFLVDKKDYGRDDKVIFSCKGTPCTLEDITPTDTDYTYIDSDSLIEDSRGTIPVVNNLPNISFSSKSYSGVSTPMSRITDMVNVVGGDIWEEGGTLYLDEQTTIPITPTLAHTFLDEEVIDYSYSDNRDSSLKVKQVLINPITEDIIAEPSTTLDYNDDTFNGEVYFNPSLTAGYTYTINGLGQREAVRSVKTETINLDADSSLTTMGGIDSVTLITIDGVPVDAVDYTLYSGWNVVRFHSTQTGEAKITYYTKSVSVYAYRTTNFKITYQCTMNEGTIDVDADNKTFTGNCYTEVVEPFTYEQGGSVLATKGKDLTFLFVEYKGATNLVQETTVALFGGGTLTVKYLYGSTDWTEKAFMNNITSAEKVTIETTNKEVIYDEDLAEYVVFLDMPIASINDIYFGSSQLSGYAYVGTGSVPYITFLATDVGKEVDISMNINLVEITIPAPTEPHPVTLFDVISCGGVATTDVRLSADLLCNLPATFKVDVAGAFDIPVEDCFGVTVTGDFGSLVIDNYGKVEVTVSTQGIFTINCNSVKENGVITIDSNGVV